MANGKKRDSTGKIQKKKVWGSKQVLASPFTPTFPGSEFGTKEAVLKIFLQIFPTPFAKREPRPKLSAKKREEMKSNVPHAVEVSTSPITKDQSIPKLSHRKPARFLCGINQVTRALEKNRVELAIVSRDVVPSFLVAHLPTLCYLNSAKLVVLSGDGTELGYILGTKRLLACGILRGCSTDCADAKEAELLLEKLSPLCAKLDYPWLGAARGLPVPALPDPVFVPHKSKRDIMAPLAEK